MPAAIWLRARPISREAKRSKTSWAARSSPACSRLTRSLNESKDFPLEKEARIMRSNPPRGKQTGPSPRSVGPARGCRGSHGPGRKRSAVGAGLLQDHQGFWLIRLGPSLQIERLQLIVSRLDLDLDLAGADVRVCAFQAVDAVYAARREGLARGFWNL